LPAAVLVVLSLLSVPASWVEVALGVFFLAMVPARRWLKHRGLRVTRLGVMLIGAPLGFLTGIVVSTGPLKVPLFTAYGLERGGLLGTEALASLAVYGTKLFTFASMGALPAAVVVKGLIAGAALMSGAFVGKHVVLRLSPHAFSVIVDALMVVSGLALLAIAFGIG
jgi:uncharacterized membrane protein YfcA